MPEGTSVNKTSYTWMYIVGGIIVLALIGWFFTRNAAEVAGVDTDQNSNGSTTYSNEQGSVTVGGNTMPSNWPSDAPDNYSGATIQYSGTSNPQTGKAGSAAVYSVKATPQAIVDHYKAELESNGWKVATTANIAGATVLSATKDTRTFGAYIVDTGDGAASVTVGIEL